MYQFGVNLDSNYNNKRKYVQKILKRYSSECYYIVRLFETVHYVGIYKIDPGFQIPPKIRMMKSPISTQSRKFATGTGMYVRTYVCRKLNRKCCVICKIFCCTYYYRRNYFSNTLRYYIFKKNGYFFRSRSQKVSITR